MRFMPTGDPGHQEVLQHRPMGQNIRRAEDQMNLYLFEMNFSKLFLRPKDNSRVGIVHEKTCGVPQGYI